MGSRANSAARDAWRHVADLWFSDEIHDRFHAACAALDVSPPQLKGLLSLQSGQMEPMRALAEGWKCDASWVTGIVDGLEQRGYVERQPHPSDRRIKVVAITSSGEEAKSRALEVLYEPPESMDALTVAELRQLRDIMAKLERARAARTGLTTQSAV